MDYPIRVAQIMGKMNNGGVEAVVMNYYRAIDKTKVQFDFIVDNDSRCPQKEEIEKLGGKVYFVPPYSKLPKYNKALKNIFEENKYKIVHSHLTTLNVFPLRIAKKCGISVRISHAHSTAGKGELIRNIVKSLLKPFSKVYPTQLFACGEYAGRWLYGNKAFNQGKVTVIPNAIDSCKFKFNLETRLALRNELGFNDENFVIGHIGRFVKQKNHAFLIDVFQEIHNQNKKSRLVLIGEGPLADNIKDIVIKKGLKDCVSFLGVKSNTFDYYNVFDLFMLPSIYEGLPVVGVEAQFNGVPCVFSNRMTKEILINENSMMLDLNVKEWNFTLTKRQSASEKLNCFDINKSATFLANKYLTFADEGKKDE